MSGLGRRVFDRHAPASGASRWLASLLHRPGDHAGKGIALPTRRAAGYLLALIFAVLCIGVMVGWRDVRRIVFLESLFSGADQVENFRDMRSLFPTRTVHHGPASLAFGPGSPIGLPETFVYEGRGEDTQAFLASTETTGLLIVKDDKIVFEQYWHGNDANSRWEAWSISKSFVSALIGVAIREGAIASVEDPVTKYASELQGSAYDGVRIKDVLRMSSGVRWNEDYGDPGSDVYRLGPRLALGLSLDSFAATLKREYAPGTFRGYDSMDAQVLGMVLRHATGTNLSDYLSAKLWVPLGMESDAYWLTDRQGVEWAAAGLNATLRDFAKLGRLYLNNGQCNGAQVVSADWVRQSVAAQAPRPMPSERHNADSDWGYGYQWWVVGDAGAYSAVGVYNQFVYVNPSLHLIIAKTSANHAYGTTDDEVSYREGEHIAFFQAIGAAVAPGASK
ncbi:MAG TPA: serine hydrolase [Burkholderiaceae bacterium]|nr:serine hydrolase [Burkholderiaceae bacterium]